MKQKKSANTNGRFFFRRNCLRYDYEINMIFYRRNDVWQGEHSYAGRSILMGFIDASGNSGLQSLFDVLKSEGLLEGNH